MSPDILIAATALAAISAAAVALAQNVPETPATFPADAQALAAEALGQRLGDQVFDAKPTTGPGWRIEFKRNGYVFIDVANGARDTGRWRVDGSHVCVEWQRLPASGCNEMRAAGEMLYLQRNNGDIVSYVRR